MGSPPQPFQPLNTVYCVLLLLHLNPFAPLQPPNTVYRDVLEALQRSGPQWPPVYPPPVLSKLVPGHEVRLGFPTLQLVVWWRCGAVWCGVMAVWCGVVAVWCGVVGCGAL